MYVGMQGEGILELASRCQINAQTVGSSSAPILADAPGQRWALSRWPLSSSHLPIVIAILCPLSSKKKNGKGRFRAKDAVQKRTERYGLEKKSRLNLELATAPGGTWCPLLVPTAGT